MQIAIDLKEASEIQNELTYIQSDEFRNFFREVVFLNCYNKSSCDDEFFIYFYTDYRNGTFDIITSRDKLNKEPLLELYFSNTHSFILDKILKNFFEDKSEIGALRTSLFDSFLLAKYNLNSYDNIEEYYNLSELLDWNHELIALKIDEERNNFALANTEISLNKIDSYVEILNQKFENLLDRYELNKNKFLAQKSV